MLTTNDRMIPVPESLIERAKEALLEVPPSSRNADIYSELSAPLSQPTPTAVLTGYGYWPVIDPSTIRDVTSPNHGATNAPI